MKKIVLISLSLIALLVLAIGAAGIYKFNYLANQLGYDVEGNKIGLHPSWDKNKDGLNDCEDDGSCDHMIDYSQPRK